VDYFYLSDLSSLLSILSSSLPESDKPEQGCLLSRAFLLKNKLEPVAENTLHINPFLSVTSCFA
jgi:hypothetical protein